MRSVSVVTVSLLALALLLIGVSAVDAAAGKGSVRTHSVLDAAIEAEVETDSEAEVDADAEAEVDAESESEVDSEAMLDAETESKLNAVASSKVDAATEGMSESELATYAQSLIDAEDNPHDNPPIGIPPKDQSKDNSDEEHPNCQTCIDVIENFKEGTGHEFGIAYGARPWLQQTVCNSLWKKDPNTYTPCHQCLYAIRNNGRAVHHWITRGCYRKFQYQQKHWIHPCPTHVICSVLRDFRMKPFCPSEKRVSQYGLKEVNGKAVDAWTA